MLALPDIKNPKMKRECASDLAKQTELGTAQCNSACPWSLAAQRSQPNAGWMGGQRSHVREGFEETMPELRLGKLSRRDLNKERHKGHEGDSGQRV